MEEPINNYYYRNKMYGLYHQKLVNAEISLKDVPEWLLEDTRYGTILYETALDPNSRGFKNHYSANMEILEHGIRNAERNGNVMLLLALQEIQETHVFWEETAHEPNFPSDELKKESDPVADSLESEPRKQVRPIDWDKFLKVIGILIELLFTVLFFVCVLDLLRRL